MVEDGAGRWKRYIDTLRVLLLAYALRIVRYLLGIEHDEFVFGLFVALWQPFRLSHFY